jgi:DNA-binding GntR family transcriptional regulator
MTTRESIRHFSRSHITNLGRLAKSHIEHDRVVEAILRGDRAGAAAAMRMHIATVGREYEAYSESL